jgi:hypothetical protein
MNRPEPGGLAWRTSSYSTNGGNCVEVAWRTSSYSGNGGSYVEVGHRAEEVLVRDTKDRPGGALTIPHTPWQALLAHLQ